MDQSAVHKTQA